MAMLTSLPDNVTFESRPGESVLEAAQRANIPIASACGGHARCSTCRIWILDGADYCPERAEAELALSERVALRGPIRLACQLRPAADLTFRRLVLDETDLRMASQLRPGADTKAGEMKPVAIFFSDVVGFTSFAESLPPYDVMYILNRYFAQVGDAIERNDGYIDKFVGDGLMAVFGVDDQPDAPLRAVNAALQTLSTVDRLKPFFSSMYDIEFDVRIGIHWGEAVLGSVGSVGHERLTVIGDAVNVASRIEAANKEAGTRFLASEPLYHQVENDVEVSDFVRIRLRGTSDRITLYEIGRLTDEARARLHDLEARQIMRSEGKEWHRVMSAEELGEGEHRIIEFSDLDVVVLRYGGEHVAFNNACPHLKLPFFDRDLPEEVRTGGLSRVTDDGAIECRWHVSSFDLHTGEIKTWGQALNDDGTSPGFEFVGDISKNRAPLEIIPCRVEDGSVWVALDER